MNSKIKKALCVAVAGASLVGALSGCSNSKEVSNVVTYWAGIPMGDGSSDAETPVTDGGDSAYPGTDSFVEYGPPRRSSGAGRSNDRTVGPSFGCFYRYSGNDGGGPRSGEYRPLRKRA